MNGLKTWPDRARTECEEWAIALSLVGVGVVIGLWISFALRYGGMA